MSEYTYNPGSHDDRVEMKTGNFVVSIVSFTRGVGKDSGVPYVRATMEGVSPAIRGAWFSTTLSFSVLWKMDRIGKAIGLRSGFDLMDDRALCNAFCGKPFKAQVIKESNSKYHDLGNIYPWKDNDPHLADLDGWTKHENTGTMKEPRSANSSNDGWEASKQDDNWSGGGSGQAAPGDGWANDPGPSDQDHQQSGGEELPSYQVDEGFPIGQDDDDLPF
uniref:Uncharacterized protein n=1 Tax=viral metagenome TaxID=1070528 RepID=A0A6M3M870_9ZZZZ